MSISLKDLQNSLINSTPPQNRKHHQNTNSSPLTTIQSPQSSTNSPVYQGNSSPYQSPQQQSHRQKHPQNKEKSTKLEEVEYKITADDLKNFRVAFTSSVADDKKIKSIDFSANGMSALFNTNKKIHFILLNPERPKENVNNFGKYGVGICKFLNPDDRIIHTSTKVDDNLRLYNIRKNGYDIYFKGHTDEVTGLEMFPSWTNNFVSASKDKTVKFWNIRHEKCIKSKSFSSRPLIACHPKELDVAIAYAIDTTTYCIEIYDFQASDIDSPIIRLHFGEQEFPWRVMKFSNDGKYLMINTNTSLTLLIDVDTGNMCHRLCGYDNNLKLPIETCFTPDSRFVLGGSQDGKVHVWNLETHDKEILEKSTPGSINKIIFNPQLMCFATAGEKFHLWIEKE